MKAVEEYTLDEIQEIDNLELRNKLMTFYQEKRLELESDPFSRKVLRSYPNCSISQLISILNTEFLEHTSFYNFPGKQVWFYPTVREYKSEFDTTCAFSGGVIRKGSLYCCYRPLLEVVNSNRTYVLSKALKTEMAYFSDLPTTMMEFDIFTQKIENYQDYQNEHIDYEALNYYFGGTVLLLELRKDRRKVRKKGRKKV